MEFFIQQVLNGISIGAIYASLALSLVLVFRITKILNFGQGEMATFSAFLIWQLHAWGLPILVAVIGSIVASAVVGAMIYLLVVRPVQYRDELTIVIITIGIFLVFNSLTGAIWGFLQKRVPSMFASGGVSEGGVRLDYELIGIVLLLAVVGFGLYALFQKTRVGLAFRAAASSPESSQLIGIPYTAMVVIGWALAGGIGALSGGLVAPRVGLDPNLMQSVIIYAFCAAVIGGLDSYRGAIVGGLLIGLAQVLCVAYLPALGSDLQVVIPLVVLVGVLAIKPEGLFGKVQVQRV